MNPEPIVFSNKMKAISAMCIWSILSPLNGMFVKLVPGNFSSIFIIEISLSIFLVPGLMLAISSFDKITLREKRAICIRGSACLASIAATFLGVRRIDYTTVYFLVMLGPLIASLAGSFVFSEMAQKNQLIACIFTIIGAFLALSPQFEYSIFEISIMLLVVATSTTLTLSSRYVGRSSNVLRNTIISLSIAGWLILPFALFQTPELEFSTWPILAAVSTTNFLAILMGAYAYEKSTISSNAPYELLKVVCAVLLGAIIFGAVPTIPALCGIAIIFLTSIAVAASDLSVFHELKCFLRKKSERRVKTRAYHKSRS
ncbi:DMT family transporter [Stappia sp.]|uniref:DMT family transporter n=1 Tax=Stappia sp. TaxID=1870903 RepID=UPI003A9925DE